MSKQTQRKSMALGIGTLMGAMVVSAIAFSGCGGGINLPSLDSADAPGVSPCPSQDLLNDPIFCSDLEAARSFSYYYVDSPTSGKADDTFCMRYNGFVAAQAEPSYKLSPSLNFSGFDLDIGYSIGFGLCGDDTNFTGNQLLQAGVYRGDVQFTNDGRTYKMRQRTTVTDGPHTYLGGTLTNAGLTSGTTDLANEVTFNVNGTAVPQDMTMLQMIAQNGPAVDLSAIMNTGPMKGEVIFNAKLEVICAVKF